MVFLRVFGVIFAILAFVVGPTFANDSEAEMAIGGLTLKQSVDVSLDSEDLFISQEEVRVDYRFTNHGAKDVDTLVAFPLPDQTGEADDARGIVDFSKDLKFSTTVDGVPAKYELVQQAIFKGDDITARLAKLHVPVIWGGESFSPTVKALEASVVANLVKEGLLENLAGETDPEYMGKWALRTTVTRHQVFRAGKTVVVKHRYVPVVGGSVGGNLNKASRKGEWVKGQIAKYCIDGSWFKTFDRAVIKRATADNASPYAEHWIGYVLKSGANWKGPINDFRLVVDKGKAENLVSFCADGVKKIGPTQFEVKKTNFEPKEDLNFLIVTWWKAQ